MQGEQPVAYASKTMSATERNYAQIEKECLSIVFACERFEQYLVGKDKIIVETDHKPLEIIFKKPLLTAPKRLQRMLLRLQRFNLVVIYKKGPEMYIADLLSRAVATKQESKTSTSFEDEVYRLKKEKEIFNEVEKINMVEFLPLTESRVREIQSATEGDILLRTLKDVILRGWPDKINLVPAEIRDYWMFREELSVQNGILLKGSRIIVPTGMRSIMLDKLHASHLGVEASLRKARDALYWPNMAEDILRRVGSCEVCQEAQPKQQKEPMMTHPTPERPWQRIGMDIFTTDGQSYLIMVDYYSDFWEVDQLPDTKAETVVRVCKQRFSTHGIPDTVDSDRGTQLDCKEFRTFASEWEFKHCTSSPHHKQSNGKAESAVKIAKRLIKRCRKTNTDVFLAILEWRNTPTQNMNSSPVQRLMSRRTKSLLPMATSLLCPKVENNVQLKINLRKQKSKNIYDQHAKELPELLVGQDVRVQLNPERRADPWHRGVVRDSLGSRAYNVDVDGHLFRRNRVHIRETPKLLDSVAGETETITLEPEIRERHKGSTTDDFQAHRTSIVPSIVSPEELASTSERHQCQTRSGRAVKTPGYLNDYQC